MRRNKEGYKRIFSDVDSSHASSKSRGARNLFVPFILIRDSVGMVFAFQPLAHLEE